MSQHEDLTGALNRELEERAHAMDGSTLHLADVQGRARSIRRRRAATAVAGAVAAVAVIVPSAALAMHSNGRPEPAPATQTPSPDRSEPTRTTSPGHPPAPGVLDVSSLATGAAPGTDYVYQGSLHLTDGSRVPVTTQHSPVQLVEMADGSRVWLTADGGGRWYVEIQDTDGAVHEPVRSTGGLSANRAHSIVAWLTPAGQVTIWEGWASQPRPLGDPVPGSDLRLGPVTGSDQAVAGQPGPSCHAAGCTVIVDVRDGAGQPWEVAESGSQPLRDGGYLSIDDDSAAGLSIGHTRLTDVGSCSTLSGGGEFRGFSTCRNTLTTFSPDGQLMLGLPAYADGAGPNELAMYDLSGKRLFDRRATQDAQATFASQVWEDDTHVLISVFQDGAWSLVRVGPDGSMEYAVAPRPGGDVTADPFLLPTGGNVPGA